MLVIQTTKSGTDIYVHKTPYSSPYEFIKGIYNADQKSEPDIKGEIKALVVPHHLVASESIATGISLLKKQSFDNIILISPDHFNKCETLLCTAEGIFETALGDIKTAKSDLKKSEFVSENNDLFLNEHGIHAVTPFIADHLSDKTIIPIVISQKPELNSVKEEVLNEIKKLLDEKTLLIISSDFSHYLTFDESEKMDELTKELILKKDTDGILKLHNPDQSDCPFCLWLLSEIADENNFYNPEIISHTNSAELLKEEDIEETTSHFVIAYLND